LGVPNAYHRNVAGHVESADFAPAGAIAARSNRANADAGGADAPPGDCVAEPGAEPGGYAAASPSPTAGASSEIASETVCPGQSDVSQTAKALTCLTANARVFHGFKPVGANDALMAAAAAKDQDMLNCGYGHQACGRDFAYWIKAKGYTGKCYGKQRHGPEDAA
jgi:hypothetical protein